MAARRRLPAARAQARLRQRRLDAAGTNGVKGSGRAYPCSVEVGTREAPEGRRGLGLAEGAGEASPAGTMSGSGAGVTSTVASTFRCRHLNLADDAADQRIGLTGSAAFFSPEATSDKLVLHLVTDTWHPKGWAFRCADRVPEDIRAFTMTPIVREARSRFFANGARDASGSSRDARPRATHGGRPRRRRQAAVPPGGGPIP